MKKKLILLLAFCTCSPLLSSSASEQSTNQADTKQQSSNTVNQAATVETSATNPNAPKTNENSSAKNQDTATKPTAEENEAFLKELMPLEAEHMVKYLYLSSEKRSTYRSDPTYIKKHSNLLNPEEKNFSEEYQRELINVRLYKIQNELPVKSSIAPKKTNYSFVFTGLCIGTIILIYAYYKNKDKKSD